jgi:hypothetical protein
LIDKEEANDIPISPDRNDILAKRDIVDSGNSSEKKDKSVLLNNKTK